jgi:hypothetical protein
MILPQTGPGFQDQFVFFIDSAGETYTNYPSADTLFKGSGLQLLTNLQGYDQIRMSVLRGATTGATGSKLSLRGYTSTSLVVGNFVELGTGGTDVEADVVGVNQVTDSGWIDLDKTLLPASGDLYLAFVAHGGDGVKDPKFIHIVVGLRSEQDAKAHIMGHLGTAQQRIQVWLNRDRHTVPNPTSASIVLSTAGGAFVGAYSSDTPDDNGIFTFDTTVSLSASTTYTVEAVVTDVDGDVSGTYDIST